MDKHKITPWQRDEILAAFSRSHLDFDLAGMLSALPEIPIMTREERYAAESTLPVGTIYVEFRPATETQVGRLDCFQVATRRGVSYPLEWWPVAFHDTAPEPEPEPEPLSRLVGPIPDHYTGPTEDEPYTHPGGPCPAWGGYRPILVEVPMDWIRREIMMLVTQQGTCWGRNGRGLRGSIWRSHTTETLILKTADGWYVAAPARPTRRAVTIGVDALRAGYPLPGGLLPEEAAEAQRIANAGGATYRARLPWETEPTTYPAAEPVDGEVEIFQRRSDDE